MEENHNSEYQRFCFMSYYLSASKLHYFLESNNMLLADTIFALYNYLMCALIEIVMEGLLMSEKSIRYYYST